MRTYARIEGSAVVEIIRTDLGIEALYHPGIAWTDVTDMAGVTEGWRDRDGTLLPPQLKASVEPVTAPSLEEIAGRIDALHAELLLLTERADI